MLLMRKQALASRLRRLHAMLGSSNAQERETAHAKIVALLAKHRKSWNDLTELMSAGDADLDPSWAAEEDRPAAGDATHAGLPGRPKGRPTCLSSFTSSWASSST